MSHKLIPSNRAEGSIELPLELMEQLALTQGEPVVLHFGSSSSKVIVYAQKITTARENEPILVAPEVMQGLRIPEGISTSVKLISSKSSQKTKNLRLGPVIGILAFAHHIPKRLGYYLPYYLKNTTGGFIYIFRGKDIDVNNNIIAGYYFDPVTNIWKTGEFPFPDSVMDRTYPESRKYHERIGKVIGPGKIFNNRTRITKMKFYRALKSDQALRQHLPETIRLRLGSELAYMLSKYENIYLKPVGSMKGFGIIKVHKTPHELVCQYTQNREVLTKVESSADKVVKFLNTLHSYPRSYIVQQGIDSVTHRGGAVSFRTCPTKNGVDKWLMPGMVALNSPGNNLITNYAAGGRLTPLRDLFDSIVPQLPYSETKLLALLDELSLKTAEALDKKIGPLGELGLDILVDKSGALWLLEANGNPGRIAAYLQNDYPQWPTMLYKCVLGYASYLAGFPRP